MNDVPPCSPAAITFIGAPARRSSSRPRRQSRSHRPSGAGRPGRAAGPGRADPRRWSVKPLKLPSSRKRRRPISMRAPSRSDAVPVTTRAQRRDDVVLVVVLSNELVDIGIGRLVDTAHQIADAVAVDAVAQPALASTLSPSVTATSRMLSPKRAIRAPSHRAGRRRRAPRRRGGPAPPGPSSARPPPCAPGACGCHEAELAVAMGRLVEVHEIHVDIGPRDVAVVLGVQVQERLAAAPAGRRSTSWPARRCASR